MPAQPHALGCPRCPFYVVMTETEPDGSLLELRAHILFEHAGYDRAKTSQLFAEVCELTEEEVR